MKQSHILISGEILELFTLQQILFNFYNKNWKFPIWNL